MCTCIHIQNTVFGEQIYTWPRKNTLQHGPGVKNSTQSLDPQRLEPARGGSG